MQCVTAATPPMPPCRADRAHPHVVRVRAAADGGARQGCGAAAGPGKAGGAAAVGPAAAGLGRQPGRRRSRAAAPGVARAEGAACHAHCLLRDDAAPTAALPLVFTPGCRKWRRSCFRCRWRRRCPSCAPLATTSSAAASSSPCAQLPVARVLPAGRRSARGVSVVFLAGGWRGGAQAAAMHMLRAAACALQAARALQLCSCRRAHAPAAAAPPHSLRPQPDEHRGAAPQRAYHAHGWRAGAAMHLCGVLQGNAAPRRAEERGQGRGAASSPLCCRCCLMPRCCLQPGARPSCFVQLTRFVSGRWTKCSSASLGIAVNQTS